MKFIQACWKQSLWNYKFLKSPSLASRVDKQRISINLTSELSLFWDASTGWLNKLWMKRLLALCKKQ